MDPATGKLDYVAVAAFVFSVLSFLISVWSKHRQAQIDQRRKDEDLALQERWREEEKLLRGIARDEADKSELLKALQGEKEAVGFTAMHLARKGLPEAPEDREKVILALVQAAVFTSSDRARAMVYAVLRKSLEAHGREIAQQVDLLEEQFKQFAQFDLNQDELDLVRGHRRLAALRKVMRN
jgi:hypothetical protein